MENKPHSNMSKIDPNEKRVVKGVVGSIKRINKLEKIE